MALCAPSFVLLLLLLLATDGALSALRIESSGPDLKVFWNVPTFMCHQYGLDFSEVQTRWGIVQNSRDVFRGDHMVILYDPGMGVVDFEAWRPVWRQNWASLLPYRDVSRKIEKQRHPSWWTPEQIEAEATHRFEKAAHDFMLLTLELLKQMRPYGQWGYYAFPYCFNYTPKNMKPCCPAQVQLENSEIQWLFEGSVALFPSLYLSKLRMSYEQHIQFMIGRMNEAVRVAQNVLRVTKPTINAYIWYRYHDVDEFLSQEDLRNSLAIVHQYNAGAVVVWGSANDTNSREKCSALKQYLNSVLGPMIKELSTGTTDSLFLSSDPDTLL